MSKNEKNEFLGEAFIETASIQINENNPPVARETYDRLRGLQYSDGDAKRVIAAVLACETLDMMKKQRPFDTNRYARLLEKLPQMPWD